MRSFRWLALPVGLLGCLPAGAQPHWIVKQKGGWVLRPPALIEHAMKQFDPSFRPWKLADYIPWVQTHYQCSARQLPFAVVGDFNGDQKPDLLIDGATRTAHVRLAFLSPGYQAQVQDKSPRVEPKSISYEAPGPHGKMEKQHGFWVYLEHLPAGKLERPVGPLPPIELQGDGFQVVYFMKSSLSYRYHQGAFREIYNSD